MPRKRFKSQSRLAAGVEAFLVLLLISTLFSWVVWDRYYDGLFKRRIFAAVLFGNAVTSLVGAVMVAGRRK